MSALASLLASLRSVFLHPIGLVAILAAVPILLLYLLKPDPDRLPFPGVRFLVEGNERARRHPALARLLRSALLAVQLLAVAMLVLSLAAPYVPVAEQRVVSETVLVVDTSASMATTADGATRFDRAVQAARGERTDQTTIVTVAPTPEVVTTRAPSTEAGSALSDIRVTDAAGDLGRAIERATTVAGPEARIVVASDFAGDGWRTAVDAAEARGHTVSLRQFDRGGAGNVGIVDRSFAGGQVTVSVKNFGSEAVSRTVTLGEASRELSLDPGGVARATLPVPAGGGRLELSPGDGFPTDDSVAVAAPSEPTLDVLVLGNGADESLVTALSVIRGTDVTVKQPPASVSGAYDLVVFSDLEPGRLLDGTRSLARETLADGGAVVIQGQSDLDALDFGGLLPVEPNGTATGATIAQPANTPLTAGTTFPAPASYQRVTLTDGRALLSATNGTPLLATASVEDGQVLYYGYPPGDQSFARSYRYPVFWKRAAYELTGRRSLGELNHETGDRLQFGSERTVEGPAGTRQTATASLDRVGFYTVGDERYGTALASVGESNVTAPDVTADDDANSGSDREQTTVPLDLTPAVAGLAGLAVLGELGFLRYRGDL